MKFFFKVLICTTLVIAVICSVGSYALTATSFDSDIQREIDRGLEGYQLTRFAFESSLLSAEVQYSDVTDDMLASIIRQTATISGGQSVAVYNAQGRCLASIPAFFTTSLPLAALEDNEQQYQISNASGTHALEIAGRITYDDQPLYLATSRNIEDIFAKKNELIRFFIHLDLVMIAAGAVLMSGLSLLLTRPIRQLKSSASRIASGRYFERANVRTKDEVGELALSFNHMAAAVEQNIIDLKQYARQQQDFVANFSHELKTPLTSIIGYADMLRSENLRPKESFKAASFIFSEGKRLEAMSLKLMDMIVLDHQSFALRPINARMLLQHAGKAVSPLLASSGIILDLYAEECIIHGEPDLLITLIINLVDNARKASDGGKIVVSGQTFRQTFRISIQDFGCGIPPDELQRITEAFYMVDKSRARAQHGAGLGLSIAQRIAQIHGSNLLFESSLNEGTIVAFELPLAENDDVEAQEALS
jgi:signal transduction histidine kinase